MPNLNDILVTNTDDYASIVSNFSKEDIATTVVKYFLSPANQKLLGENDRMRKNFFEFLSTFLMYDYVDSLSVDEAKPPFDPQFTAELNKFVSKHDINSSLP